MIGHQDKRPVNRQRIGIGKAISRTQKKSTNHQTSIEKAYAFCMGLISQYIMTKPLNGMKDQEGYAKNDKIDYG